MVLNKYWVVPVIVLLTKADATELQAIGQLRDEGLQMQEAMLRARSLAPQILSDASIKIKNQLDDCKYPPKDYLSLGGKLASLGPFIVGMLTVLHY